MRNAIDGINGIPHSEEAAQLLSRRTQCPDPAVIAGFARDYQRARHGPPRISSAGEGSAHERTARSPLFRRCFSLFLWNQRAPSTATQGMVSTLRRGDICMYTWYRKNGLLSIGKCVYFMTEY